MYKLRTRLFISLGSLVFFLLLLELGLRFGGYVYTQKLLAETTTEKQDGSPYTILTIGDSYTVGGQGAWQDSYPSQLNRLLSDRNPGKFSVINGGICEANSTQALRHLSKMIQDYKVDSVFLLTGAANRFNLVGYPQNKGIDIFSHFRLYKIAKIFMINLKSRMFQKQTIERRGRVQKSPEDSDDIDMNQDKENEAEALLKAAIKNEPNQVGAYLELALVYEKQHRDEKAEKLFMEVLRLGLEQGLVYKKLGDYYQRGSRYADAAVMYQKAFQLNPHEDIAEELVEIYVRLEDYVGALEMALEGVALSPAFAEQEGYYVLAKAYEFQNKYDAKNVLQHLHRIAEGNPVYNKSNLYRDYVSLFKDREIMEKKIDRWLKDDLEEIVRLCRINDIQLVIQSYPYPYHSVNRYLKEMAEKYDLPFVDHYSVFKELTPHKKYFVDSDHCTAEGHNVMAENIYSFLVSD